MIRTLREQLLSTLIGHPENRPDIPDGQALIGQDTGRVANPFAGLFGDLLRFAP